MRVDQRRLREDLETNGQFGAIDVNEGHGRTVLTGSEADQQAREYFVERLEDASCEVRIDPVGNIAGRWVPDGVDPETESIALGSHLDSVPRGGIFDGPLGVYGALEALRTLQESDREIEHPIEVVSWTEEEGGRFDIGLLGSSTTVGDHDVDESLDRTDDSGISLREHLERIGFHGDDEIDPAAWNAWFELHVEQGRRLIEADVQVGIVTAITGITNCKVEIASEPNHAGTTPISRRSDSVAAASEVVLDLERAAREITLTDSESAVGTIGKLDIEPGARNVIAGTVDLRLDIRDVDKESMDALVDRTQKSLARLEASRGVDTDLDRYRYQPPVRMSDRCREAVRQGGEQADIETMDLHSGGGHDTMKVAEVTDAVLLFAPSWEGISHNPLEWTDWDDCAAATQVLANGVANLATD